MGVWIRAVLWVICTCGCVGVVSRLVWPMLACWFCGRQNLRAKYGAQWALVTGGTSGIGRSYVMRLASEGINVVVCGLDDEKLSRMREDLPCVFPGVSFRFLGIQLDEVTGVESLIKEVGDLLIGLVFLNAGWMMQYPLQDVSPSVLSHYIHTMVSANILLCQHFYSAMLSRGAKGAIVITGSATALFPTPFLELYSASKAFLGSFSSSFSFAAKKHNIDIACVQPGFVCNTGLYDHLGDQSQSQSQSPQTTPRPRPRLNSVLRILRLVGQTPDQVADSVWRCLGRPGMCIINTGLFTHPASLALGLLGPGPVSALMRTLVCRFGLFADMDAEESRK
ncbi:short-chain dehydrogenase [Pelomyxa schiedti]|nr:short-chain dehydrogenase [Pelomyxa schiedti]